LQISFAMNKNQKRESDQIDLLYFLSIVWQDRWRVLKITIIFTLLGLVLALITPNTYTAKSIFIAQSSGDKSSSGSLGGLASLAGVNLGGLIGNDSGISPMLYPKLFYSLSFRKATLDAPLLYKGKKLTYSQYLKQKPTSIRKFLKKYTIGLPGVLIKLIKGNDTSSNSSISDSSTLRLTEEEYLLIKGMEGKITLSYNEMEGYNTLIVTDTDANIAAQLAKWLEAELQHQIIDYKIKNSQELYEFTLKEFNQKQQEVYRLQKRIAQFTEKNQNLNSALSRLELLRLEAEYDMLNAVYSELARQKEEIALQIKKDTPIFSVIDPVSIPNRKSAPKRSIMLVISAFLGAFISIGYVLLKEPILSILQKVKQA